MRAYVRARVFRFHPPVEPRNRRGEKLNTHNPKSINVPRAVTPHRLSSPLPPEHANSARMLSLTRWRVLKKFRISSHPPTPATNETCPDELSKRVTHHPLFLPHRLCTLFRYLKRSKRNTAFENRVHRQFARRRPFNTSVFRTKSTRSLPSTTTTSKPIRLRL